MAISDHFSTLTPGLNSPAQGGFDVTPDDASDLTVMPRALMVTGAGDIAVVFKDGSALTLTGLIPGVIYPLRVTRVMATGTTATQIKALF